MSEWIKCSNRLPPDDSEILAFGDLTPGAIGEVEIGKIQVARYSGHDQYWSATGDIQYGASMENVTHWMSLPAHPAK